MQNEQCTMAAIPNMARVGYYIINKENECNVKWEFYFQM